MIRWSIALTTSLTLALSPGLAHAGPAGPTGPPQDLTVQTLFWDNEAKRTYVELSWGLPTGLSPADVTAYEVSVASGAQPLGTTTQTTFTTVTTSFNPLAMELTPFSVRATTNSDAGSYANTVPAAIQSTSSQPSNATAIAGNGTLTITWDSPQSVVWPILSYRVKLLSAGGSSTCVTTQMSCTFTGLLNGLGYTAVVQGISQFDMGGEAATLFGVVPGSAPDAPTAVKAIPGPGSAMVSWAKPAGDGGFPITTYRVTSTMGSRTCHTDTVNCTVTGLGFASSYRFTVVAINARGESPASAPSNVITTAKLVQKADARLPSTLKGNGTTVVLDAAVKTNAGRIAKAHVRVTPTRNATVTQTTRGRVTVTVDGRPVTVVLRLRAPGNRTYQKYLLEKRWSVNG